MERTENLHLNKPDREDKVLVNDLNKNSDILDIKVADLEAQILVKANSHAPTFSGLVKAPKPGTQNSEQEIYEQVVTTGYVIDNLTVENLDDEESAEA